MSKDWKNVLVLFCIVVALGVWIFLLVTYPVYGVYYIVAFILLVVLWRQALRTRDRLKWKSDWRRENQTRYKFPPSYKEKTPGYKKKSSDFSHQTTEGDGSQTSNDVKS